MKVYKTLERKSQILGLPLTEFALVVCLLLTFILLGSFMGFFFSVPGWYYLITGLLVLGVLLILKRAHKQKHPSFLLSWISYHFYQPTITMHHEKT